MKKRVRCIVHGRVQGVFFRGNTVEEAAKLGLTGWVRNNSDGTVEAVFEGEEEAIEKILEWCKHGPPLSIVTKMQSYEEPYTGEFKDFKIVYF